MGNMSLHSRSSSISKCSNTENDDNKEEKDHPNKKSDKKNHNFLEEYFIAYTNNSNLHGLKYIGENERAYIERIFWLFAFICGCVLCAGLIVKTYNKWSTSPVIVTFAEKTTPTWQIPYPAITICLESKSRATVFNFTENYNRYNDSVDRHNMRIEELNMTEDLTLVCDDKLASLTGREYSDGGQTVDNLLSVTTNATSTFFMCKFKDRSTPECGSLNARVVTDEGICFTFNSLRPDDMFKTENLHTDYSYIDHNNKSYWTLEDGYSPDAPLDTYPYRGAGSTAKAGVAFLMQTNATDLDYLCKESMQGFKILVHNPAEMPRLNDIYFRVSLNQELVIAVTPKMITTAEGLREYDSERRRCYFSDERYLHYFKVYTQTNCELECLTNYTYSRCGCVHFGMPHNSSMRVCNTAKVACMKQARAEFSVVELKKGFEKNVLEENISEAVRSAASCSCLPGCSTLSYEAETSQADYDFKQLCRAYNVTLADDVNENWLMTRLSVFFKAPQFIQYQRSELYSLTDFLANCGGLLGLFMGFSFLSLAEIVYFISLRLCCVVYQQNRINNNAETDASPTRKIQDTVASKNN
ncbi:pickpocket protein 28-like [Plodia interpunctella]|uniref:pickpocket protein 28-like n=1 Tax=Plodia interpunctella TaxID=58824 RepID=UPI0023678E35|nr:pickpocket protein 28-like [Plodia interpunctella]